MLAIIDANNLLVRAHFGAPSLSDSKGQLTGAIFGVIQSLAKIIRDMAPDALFMAWDGGRDPERLALYPEYKGNRASKVKSGEADTDSVWPEIYRQGDLLRKELLPLLGVVQLRRKDVEADDIIGSAVPLFREMFPLDTSIIVSGDEDFYQCIGAHVVVYSPMMKRHSTDKVRGVTITPDNFREVTGIADHENYIDYKAMVGDPSDNIKGIEGVGPQTARALVNEWGNIVNIYANREKILSQKPPSRVLKVFEKSAARIIKRNMQLMFLKDTPELREQVKATMLAARSLDVDEIKQRIRKMGSMRMLVAMPKLGEYFEAQTRRHQLLMRTYQARLESINRSAPSVADDMPIPGSDDEPMPTF